MSLEAVVVTGIGVISPLGHSLNDLTDASWLESQVLRQFPSWKMLVVYAPDLQRLLQMLTLNRFRGSYVDRCRRCRFLPI